MNTAAQDIQSLFRHELPGLLRELGPLRRFTEHHIYAVWDFMSLLKSLQQDLCPSRVPWVAPEDAEAARFINEIVVDEESDEVAPGRFLSHYCWYREAMTEIGADLGAFDELLRKISAGASLREAIARSANLPEAARAFLRVSAAVLEEPLVVRAAVFVRAREAIIPGIFAPLSRSLKARGLACPTLIAYLDRHIEVDGEDHGPRAQALLDRLLLREPEHRLRAERLADQALAARRDLWDALAAELGRQRQDAAGV
jgi:DUF3050 family protein